MPADIMSVKDVHHQGDCRGKGVAGDIGARKARNRGSSGEAWEDVRLLHGWTQPRPSQKMVIRHIEYGKGKKMRVSLGVDTIVKLRCVPNPQVILPLSLPAQLTAQIDA